MKKHESPSTITEITITCECGHKTTTSPYDIYIFDTTPCSCGQCRGEQYKIEFGNCESCNKELIWNR